MRIFFLKALVGVAMLSFSLTNYAQVEVRVERSNPSALQPMSPDTSEDPHFPIFPVLSPPEDFEEKSNKDRILIIPSPSDIDNLKGVRLQKAKSRSETNFLPVGGYVSVYTKNFNYYNVKEITISQNGRDRNYEFDLKSIYSPDEEEKKTDDKESLLPDPTDSLEFFPPWPKDDFISQQLKAIEGELKNLNNGINIQDFRAIQAFKDSLRSYSVNNGNNLSTPRYSTLYSSIMRWQPTYVAITTFPKQVSDNDILTYTIEVKSKDDKEYKEEYTYNTSRRLSVSVNNHLFFTKLVNRTAYRDSISDDTKVVAALEDKDWSVGIGAGAEVSYRTGGMLRPTVLAAFFVPFEEDIIPYFALAPGLSFGTGKVKLSFSAGWAFGKVNSIKDRYKGVDISDITDLEANVIEKRWKSDCVYSFGLSYNLNK